MENGTMHRNHQAVRENRGEEGQFPWMSVSGMVSVWNLDSEGSWVGLGALPCN